MTVKRILIVLLLFLPLVARAASFTDGTFAYEINRDKQTVTVVANTSAYSGDLVLPATVTNDGQTYEVTEIGESAFKDCTRLYSIQLPEGLKIIGSKAFSGCTGLEIIKLPNSLEQINYAAFKGCRLLEKVDLGTGIKAIYGNYDGSTGSGAFEDCTSLISINIPASVTEINASVFRGCTALERVTLQNGVEHIGSHCFQNCSSLTSIYIPSSVTNIGASNFQGCRALESAVLGSGLTTLGEGLFSGCQALERVIINNGCAYIPAKCFQNCTSLTEISVPGSVEYIGYAAFKGCRSLEKVVLGQGIITIYGNYDGSTGSGAFEDCISLENIVIPNSVTEMNASTFRGCTSLKSITLSKALLHIGSHCFQNCESLTSIVIPNNVSSLGAHMFSGCKNLQSAVLGKGITSMGNELFKGCSALEEVTIEKGCGLIAAMTFQNCTSLTAISIPGSVEYLGYSSFKGCTSLKTVKIDKGLTTLYGNYNGSTGSGTFEDCTALEEVVLPSSLTTINASVFRNCKSLKRFTIQATVLPEVGTNVFQNASVSEATLFVPEKSIEKYQAAEPWSQFGTIKTVEEGTQQTVYPSSSYELSADGKKLLKWNGPETEIDLGKDPVLAKVTDIDDRAFFNNEYVEKLTLNEGLTFIGNSAFHGLGKLTTLNLPSTLTFMSIYNFTACKRLKDISVAEGNTVYSTADGVLFMKEGDGLQIVLCGEAKTGEYIFPANIKSVGWNAFYFCDGITSVKLNNGLERIERQGFYDCKNLKSITMPEGLVSIGEYAFTDCISLSKVELPSTIQTIAEGAFLRCTALETVTCLNPEPPQTDNSAFDDSSIGNAKLIVPVQGVAAYRQAYPWSRFDSIEAIGGETSSEWYMKTDDGTMIPMKQVSMLVAADDDVYFAVLDTNGNFLHNNVKRARFLIVDPVGIKPVSPAEQSDVLKRFVNNQLIIVGVTSPVEVYNMAGVKVLDAKPTGSETVVNVGILPTGTYIVKCGKQSFKFMKK